MMNMTEPATSPLMRLRTQRHLTQKELADALGVTENTIANWERGSDKTVEKKSRY